MVDFTPTQLANTPPSYDFKAVSQGSQCGQYVMPTSTTMIDYSDKIAKMQVLFGITTSARYKLTAKIKALPALGYSNTVCYSKMERNIRFFFGVVGTGWSTTSENTRPSPSNTIPWDCVPGGTQSLSGRNGSFGDNSLEPSVNSSHTFFGNVWRAVVFPLVHLRTDFTVPYLQDLFTFVPITSSLDIANADINKLNETHIFTINGLAGSRAVNYIAQEKFINTISSQPINFYNRNHTDFSARNAEWMFNEIENKSNSIACTFINDCYSPVVSLSTNQYNCDEATVTATANGNSYSWTVDGDLLINGTTTTLTTSSNSIDITGTKGFIYVSTSYACSVSALGQIEYDPFKREIAGLYPEYLMNDHISVSVNTTAYDTYYRWYVNNTLVKQGANADTYCTCDAGGSGTTYYVCSENTIRVEVDVDCGTSASESLVFWWICGYGIQSNVELYPNPAKSLVNIKLTDLNKNMAGTPKSKLPKLSQIKQIIIKDKLGNIKKIFNFQGNNNVSVNVSNLPTDIYFVEVSDGVNKVKLQLSVVR